MSEANLLERVVSWLFPHRHKWRYYRLVNTEHYMYFYCRKCDCGADEMLHQPLTKKEWRCRSISARHEWEQQWIDDAVVACDS